MEVFELVGLKSIKLVAYRYITGLSCFDTTFGVLTTGSTITK